MTEPTYAEGDITQDDVIRGVDPVSYLGIAKPSLAIMNHRGLSESTISGRSD